MAEYKESLGEDEIFWKLVMDLLIGWINQNVYFRHKCTDDDDDDDKTEHSHKLARTEWNCKKEAFMLLNTITAYPDNNEWYWN